MAKHYGSYEKLKGGNISEALVDLTGAPVEVRIYEYVCVHVSFNLGEKCIHPSPLPSFHRFFSSRSRFFMPGF